jgi:hypothetical protein
MSDICAIHGAGYMSTAGVCILCGFGATTREQLATNWPVVKGPPVYDPSSLTVRLSVEGMEKYTYTFHPAPAHGSTFSRSLDAVFELVPMITLDFTESEFKQFRLDLLRDGFELHEVSRVPYHVSEVVL